MAHLLRQSIIFLNKYISVIHLVRITEQPDLATARGPSAAASYPASVAEAMIAGALGQQERH